MDISGIKLPRALEADSDDICQALSARTVRLWSASDLSIPLITISDPLKKELQSGNLNGRIRCGLEAISEKLDSEKKGIDHLQKGKGLQGGERVSRLLLVSNDGAERFYRRIEGLLRLHTPRLLCCMLDVDSNTMGNIISGKERQIKAVMAEHKETVSEILRTLLAAK
jgi:hypothetical protein